MFNERSAQKESTRQAVLGAARAQFAKVGFEAANLRAIAREAGVSAGTIIHHFGDKQDLLHAALFDDLDRVLERALASPGAGPLEAQLSRLTGAVFAYYQRKPRLSRTLLKESLFAQPPWAKRFAEQTAGVHQGVARLVTAAKDRRELQQGLDAPVFAVAWLSFFYFGLIAWAQGGQRHPIQLVDRLVAQHLEGFRRVAR